MHRRLLISVQFFIAFSVIFPIGQLATSIADATHIVLPESVVDTKDPEHYFRALEHRGNKVFAHWWYFPDSYDTWVLSQSDSIEAVTTPVDGRWKVSQDWLLLLDEFNEWMNEGDFEVNEVPPALAAVCGVKEDLTTRSSKFDSRHINNLLNMHSSCSCCS